MIYFVGVGPGAEDLITVRGQNLLARADLVIYAGSLVNPGLLSVVPPECRILDSASMTLEEVVREMKSAHLRGETVVRLQTGDPCLYGAIREQMDLLEAADIPYEVVPGVSSFIGAAAALKAELTLPEVSQTVILTRMQGRTPVPGPESIASLASHQATMVIFLSAGMIRELSRELVAGGISEDCPVAIVYKATWPEEKIIHTTVGEMAEAARRENITRTALIVVGRVLEGDYARSRLYDPSFTHGYREAIR